MQCRLIKIEDSEDILDWRNDFASRAMSINSHMISWDEHSSWFSEMLENILHLGYIGEINGEKIGVVFFKVHEGNARVSITLNPRHRGKKMAVVLLGKAMRKAQNDYSEIYEFFAEIHNTNNASIKIFTKHGYKLFSKSNLFSKYTYKLEKREFD